MAQDSVKNITDNGVESALSHYLHAKGATTGTAVSGTFELTRRCNFNCRMCYVHNCDCSRDTEKELTAAQWIDIGGQAAEKGLIFLLLTGGEPLIRKDFAEIYANLNRLGLSISVNTNGSLLDCENARIFEDVPPSRLNISLYGADDDTYMSLCGGKYFDRVTKNIDRMQSLGIGIKISLSITPYNAADVEKIHSFAAERGIPVKASSYMYPPVRCDFDAGENPARFPAKEAAAYRVKCDLLKLGREEFLKRADNLGYHDECIDFPDYGDESRCRAGRSAFWIDWQGNMSMCGMIPSAFSVTELGFAACWEKVREFTKQIKMPPECRNCLYRKVCPVCAAACVAETGSFVSAPQYLCEFSKETARLIREYK